MWGFIKKDTEERSCEGMAVLLCRIFGLYIRHFGDRRHQYLSGTPVDIYQTFS